MTNKTYRSVFTGKEIDEAIIFLKNTKSKEIIESGSLASGASKILFSFDYKKYNYAQICVSSENPSGQLFVMESKSLVNKLGNDVLDETISTMGNISDSFSIDTIISDGMAHVRITAISVLQNIKSVVTMLL